MTAPRDFLREIRIRRALGAWLFLFALVLVGAGTLAHDCFAHHEAADSHCSVCVLSKHSIPLAPHAEIGPALAEMESTPSFAAAPAPPVLHESRPPRGPPSLPV